MPFTPIHMGPGAAIKALSGRYFSLMVFGFAQIAIDLESLIRILRGDLIVHGFTHTYLGALLVGAFSLFAGKAISERLLGAWNAAVSFKYTRWLLISPKISWVAASSGAFVGTVSHVFLDSIMHSDMHPFAPFSDSNDVLHIMSVGWLNLLCVALGVFGVMVLVVVGLWNRWSIEIE